MNIFSVIFVVASEDICGLELSGENSALSHFYMRWDRQLDFFLPVARVHTLSL